MNILRLFFAVKTFLVNLERIIPFTAPIFSAKSILKILGAVVEEVEAGRPEEITEMEVKTELMEEEIDKIKANLALHRNNLK